MNMAVHFSPDREVGCWCRCRMPLQDAAAKCCCQNAVCALELGWAPLKGAAAESCFGAWLLVLLSGCRCESVVCALEFGSCQLSGA